MLLNSEEKLQMVNQQIERMALLGFRLDQLLVGFKLYNSMKNTLDIEEYEQVLDVFVKAIDSMEHQLNQFNTMFWELKQALK